MNNLRAVLGRARSMASSPRSARFSLVLAAVLAAAVTSSAQDAARPNQPAAVETTSLVLEKYIAPVYPQIAASNRVQGIVIIDGMVAAAGHAGDLRVLRSVPLLDSAAMDAVRQWRFATPATGTRFTAVVNFVLSDTPAADEAPARSVGWPPEDFALYTASNAAGVTGN